MNKMLLKLAAERAIQVVQFSNFKVALAGDPSVVKLDSRKVIDTTEQFDIDAIEIPVTVRYSEIKENPADLLSVVPEVKGSVMLTEHTTPFIVADFAVLGKMREAYDAKAKTAAPQELPKLVEAEVV